MFSEEDKNRSDFFEFLTETDDVLPQNIRDEILGSIHKKMHPKPALVILKLLIIHSMIGFASLSVCHQFDMNPFNTSSSLADIFMNLWGHNICMILCGILFLSLSIFFAGFFLSMEEFSLIDQHNVLHNAFLGILSISAFLAFGADFVLVVFLLWLLGAVLGGFISTKPVFHLKQNFAF